MERNEGNDRKIRTLVHHLLAREDGAHISGGTTPVVANSQEAMGSDLA